MENKSIWKSEIRKRALKKLNENITTDILIIGGGISGLTTAYFLRKSKYKITLIDKDICGHGVSENTTGKLTFVQDLIYSNLTKNFNEEIALKYLNSCKDAIKIVKTIISRNKIECNLENVSSYVFTNDINKIENFKKEEEFYNKNNIKYKVVNKLPNNLSIKYGLKVNYGSVFHPVKYLMGIRKMLLESKIDIYENTRAIKLTKKDDYYEVITENGTILAKKVIVCTHYPFFIIPGILPLKSSIEKSYVVSGITPINKKFVAISNENPVYSIRYHTDDAKTYIIYAGSSHCIANHFDAEKRYKELINDYKNYIGKDIKYYFLNHDVMTPDHLPYIGSVYKNDNSLLIATGFNKWGMTNGTIAGKILSDIVLDKDNKYIELFSLHRKITKDKVKNLIVYNYLNAKTYILTKVKKEYTFYHENIEIKTIEGKKIGIYTDKKNTKHMVYITCPHLKCNLIFNSIDKTWDCPCHGSRFDIDGNILFGPSVYDIKVNKDANY